MSETMSQRPTRIVVDLDALSHNLHAIRAHVGVPVMAIVKANAYGHGLVPVAHHLHWTTPHCVPCGASCWPR